MANSQLLACPVAIDRGQTPRMFALDFNPLPDWSSWQPSSTGHETALMVEDNVAASSTSDEDMPSDVSGGLQSALREEISGLSDHVCAQNYFRRGITNGRYDQMVTAPFEYVQHMPSKGVRSTLINALNEWYSVPPNKLQKIGQVIDILHNASLMLDDIEDNSPLRRGYPAAHRIFNQAPTINSANFAITDALSLVRNELGSECLDIYLKELQLLYIGQGWDLYWTSHVRCPSIPDYISSIDYKTGGLFRMACGMMKAESETARPPPTDYMITLLGRYFQIRDDYQNLESPDYANQKGFCEDLDEGKFSLPLIHCMNCQPDMILEGLLQERRVARQMSFEAKQLILEQFDKTQSLVYTRQILGGIFAKIESEVAMIEREVGKVNPKLRAVLGKLAI